MLHRIRSLALVFTAAFLALGSFAGLANATTEFTMSPAGAIEAPSIGKLTFTAEGRTVECNTNLRGSMNAGPIRIAGGEMGTISEVRIENCVGGTIERVLIGTAWRVVSNRILGSLPEGITGALFTIRATKFQFALFGGLVRCLYEGDAGALIGLTHIGTARYDTEEITALEESVFRKVTGVGCPTEGRMSGNFRFTSQTLTVR